MSHDHKHLVLEAVKRSCICPTRLGDEPHTPECEQQHRDTFMAAWRGARARFYGSER
jgi:hypothetical protein